MVTPGGGAFLVADGAVVTQVSTSSSRCVHFMQIIAHAKRNRLDGCHAHSAPLALALPSEAHLYGWWPCSKWVLSAPPTHPPPTSADLRSEVIVW